MAAVRPLWILVLALCWMPVSAIAQVTELPVRLDAFVNAVVPDENMGSKDYLQVRVAPEVASYLKFDVPDFRYPPLQSELILRVEYVKNSIQLEVRAVLEPWSESAVTYNSRPLVGPPLTTVSLTPQDSGNLRISIGDLVAKWSDGSLAN